MESVTILDYVLCEWLSVHRDLKYFASADW